MADEVLSKRALNRALLGRQMLLEGPAMSVRDALEHLVGLQAQNPLDPYFGLWSRLEGFVPEELSTMVADRGAVRTWLMRGTIHLVTARDCLALRPVMDSVIRKQLAAQQFGRDTAQIDRDELTAAAREAFAGGPMTRAELGRRLARRWPEVPAESLGLAASCLLPLVQVPPRGTWGATNRATMQTVDRFLGKAPAADDDPADVVLRYLRAFGPAAPKDVRAWSGKTGLREVIDRLRPQLRTFRDENGTELLDVPDGLLPDPETPAPPRFLPEYDNALLSHDDRSRIVAPGDRARLWWKGSVLVDGFVAGTWKLERAKDSVTLAIGPWAKWSKRDRAAIEEEAERLVEFAAAEGEVAAVRIDRPADFSS